MLQGVKCGTIGFAKEIGHGVVGVYQRTAEGYRHNTQRRVRGAVVGLGVGVVGLIVCPFTGMLRLINNLSSGISGTANSFADLGRPKVEVLDTRLVRVRLPRRIDVRGQIKIYDDDMAVVHRYLGLAGKTLAKNVFNN